ncbi:unnamed protein product [Peniophora sp. CBMAI 1063]|nr:unnamed protein product [Peniophora sp. CBMAI 1063]
MSPAPHVVYSEELSGAFKRGHPIANPQPVNYHIENAEGEVTQSGLTPVQIGDVGYIQPELGFFVRLFNVHQAPGAGGQPDLDDLPEGFEILPRSTVATTEDTTPVFVSQSVKTKNINASASGPFFGGFAGFSASSKRGAILATPDPIQSHNALHILSYKRYAQEKFESWHEFAIRKNHDVNLEALMLVTGVDLTTSWATAVFNDTKLDAGFGLRVQFASAGSDVHLACQFSWQSTFRALVNSGPARRLPPSSLADETSTRDTSTSIEPHESQPLKTVGNQTLFIRHIRAKARRPWRGLQLRAAGGDDRRFDASDNDSDASSVPVSAQGTAFTGDDIVATRQPQRGQYHDCLDPALDYILEASTCNVAIAHDNDLEYLQFPNAVRPQVVIRGGVAIMDGKLDKEEQPAPQYWARRNVGPPRKMKDTTLDDFLTSPIRTSVRSRPPEVGLGPGSDSPGADDRGKGKTSSGDEALKPLFPHVHAKLKKPSRGAHDAARSIEG